MISLMTVLTKLISFPSITPQDEGCQEYMIALLEESGFSCQRFNNPPVANFFARFGQEAPLLIFAGHTDVVPVGEAQQWQTDPFVLHEENGLLYGRGTADMKGSLACMIVAAAQFVKDYPDFKGSLGFLITSAEEGNHFDLGTPFVMAQLQKQGIKPDYCIVGEPSSTKQVGDVIKNGRRGSLNTTIVIEGKQGHVAYPHLAENPIHKVIPALLQLTTIDWDKGNAHFPPTTLQVTNIQAGHAANIIPGLLTLQVNIRFSNEQSVEKIQRQIQACFTDNNLIAHFEWKLSGEPFLTASGILLEKCIESIQEHTGYRPKLSTSGGTSDGRFIAPYQVEVIELGPINATIHQVNEHIALADLEVLTEIYYTLCKKVLLK